MGVLATEFSSTNFTVQDPTIDAVVGESSSTNFSVQGTIPFISPIPGASTNFTINTYGVTLPVLSATAATHQVSLSWTAVIGVSGPTYEVGTATISGGPYDYKPSQTDRTATLTSLQANTLYYFIIRVTDDSNSIVGFSNQVSATPESSSIGGSAPPSGLPASLIDTLTDRLQDFLISLVPDFLEPSPPGIATNDLERFVPRIAPLAFRGWWTLLPPAPLREIALRPLPPILEHLASQFPQLGDLFSQVGITRFQDLQKLRNVTLRVPGLSDILALPSTDFAGGAIPKIRALTSLASLTPELKKKLPTDIVFARVGGGTIDLSSVLRIDEQGETRTQVRTIAGKQMVLLIKPEGKPKSVKGYFLFKARVTSAISPIRPIGLIPVAQAAEADMSNRSYKTDRSDQSDRSNVATTELVLLEFAFTDDDGDGIYLASIDAPLVAGDYEILTVVDYGEGGRTAKAIRLLAVVDPEGYIYENQNNKELRIPGAIVTLEWLNSETMEYELWPATEFAQDNPQVTSPTGEYSYLVPPGLYRLQVTAPGYLDYDGKPFEVRQGSGVHTNIALKTRFWFVKLFDWKTIALVLVGVLLLYNFYRDKRREERLRASASPPAGLPASGGPPA